MSIVPFISGEPIVYTNSLEVSEQILRSDAKLELIKPEDLWRPFMYAENIPFLELSIELIDGQVVGAQRYIRQW